ncbi:MAG: hypothetical protein ACTHZX_07755 [Microbacterium sp.]
MGYARVEQGWTEYARTGRLVIGSSITKGLLGMIGMLLLAALAAGMAYDGYATEGLSALKTWGCGLMVLVCLLGVFASALPLARRRRLVLGSHEIYAEIRRGGRREDEMRLRWEDIESVAVYRNTNGESTTVDVRMTLMPGVTATGFSPTGTGYRDLPRGLRMSKKDLAALVERIRASRHGA